MKSGRSSNGKGHFWIIHPANLEDFSRGDFRRRRAQRRVRRSLGLTLPEEDAEDEEESDLLTPPSSLSPVHPTKNYTTGSATSTSNNHSANSSASSDYIQGSYKRRFEDSDNKNDGSSRSKKVCGNSGNKQQANSHASNKHSGHGYDTNNDSAGNNESKDNNSYNDSTDSKHGDNNDNSDNNDCTDGNNNFSNRLTIFRQFIKCAL